MISFPVPGMLFMFSPFCGHFEQQGIPFKLIQFSMGLEEKKCLKEVLYRNIENYLVWPFS